MDWESMHSFSEGLATLHHLTHLRLDQKIQADTFMMHHLSAALHEVSSQASLSLQGLHLSKECCRSLRHALACPALSGLQELDVQFSRIGEDDLESLSNGLGYIAAAESTTSPTCAVRGNLRLTQLT